MIPMIYNCDSLAIQCPSFHSFPVWLGLPITSGFQSHPNPQNTIRKGDETESPATTEIRAYPTDPNSLRAYH